MKRYCTPEDLTKPKPDCILRDGQSITGIRAIHDTAPCGCGTGITDSAPTVTDAMQRNCDRTQAHIDHYTWKAEQHQRAIDADPRASAYQRMVAGMQYGGAR